VLKYIEETEDFNVKEVHISPWAVANESILGWIKWIGHNYTHLILRIPKDMKIEGVYNISTEYIDLIKGNTIVVPKNLLETEGYIAFELVCVKIYDKVEVQKEIEYIFMNEETVIYSGKLITKIVRPKVELTFKPNPININNKVDNIDTLEIMIEEKGAVPPEGISLEEEFKIESEIRDIVRIKVEYTTESPMVIMPIEIKILRKGTAKLHIFLSYYDPFGNKYTTENILKIIANRSLNIKIIVTYKTFTGETIILSPTTS